MQDQFGVPGPGHGRTAELQSTIVWHEANQGLFQRQFGIPSGIGVGTAADRRGEWAGWVGLDAFGEANIWAGDVTCVQNARERTGSFDQRPRAHS